MEVPIHRDRNPRRAAYTKPGAPTGRRERPDFPQREDHEKMTFAEEIIRLDRREILHDKRHLPAQLPVAPLGL